MLYINLTQLKGLKKNSDLKIVMGLLGFAFSFNDKVNFFSLKAIASLMYF